jgi:hypothetical protein
MASREPASSLLRWVFTVTLVTLVTGALANPAAHAQQNEPSAAGGFAAFLPYISAPSAPPQPAPPAEGSAIFMEPNSKTGSPDIAIDAQGGTHLVYRYHVPVNENPDGIYAYCPAPSSSCADPARWQRLNIGGPVDSIQIALTPAGQPRVLAIGPSQGNSSYASYYYGECNANCLSEAGWSFVNVTSSYTSGDLTGYYLPKRSFALDPQGRPRFVFGNADFTTEPDLYGGYYATCDSGCDQAESWSISRFTHQIMGESYLLEYEQISQLSLDFTTDGRPRVVAMLYPMRSLGQADGIYYFACDEGCEDDANWDRAWVFERGNGPYPMWDIAIDGQNRPRIAIYKEDTLDGTGRRLYFLQCDGGCLNSAAWQTANLGLSREVGDGVDLELDAQGRPRLAYLNGSDNLGYSWCNAGCTDPAAWQHVIAESSTQLEAEYPVARPVTCNAGLWDTYAPSLALDAQGHPHVGYNGSYKARCQYQDPNDPGQIYDTFLEIWHSVRLVTFAQQ